MTVPSRDVDPERRGQAAGSDSLSYPHPIITTRPYSALHTSWAPCDASAAEQRRERAATIPTACHPETVVKLGCTLCKQDTWHDRGECAKCRDFDPTKIKVLQSPL